MKNYLKKIFNPRQSSAGFTLIELLVAASITTVVVGASGYGLVSIMSANRTASAQTDRRMELNRALDFMADEVRQTNAINRIAAPVASKPSSMTTVEAGTVQSILVLEIPTLVQPVVYHIAQPQSSTPWLGPRAIYRWGPGLDNNGNYNSTWTNEPLVDLIEDEQPSPNPVCSNHWTPSPNAPARKGFYACIDPTRRIAELHLLGKVTKAYGSSAPPYKVSSKVFSRVDGAGAAVNLFNLNNSGGVPGVLTPITPITLNFKMIGGSITCGAGGAVLPTSTRVSTDNGSIWTTMSGNEPLNLTPLGATNQVVVEGRLVTSACGGINQVYRSTDTTQVKALRNGDRVPDVQAFGNQTTIDTYLREYIDPTTNRISIANNEVIYLYEMGSNDPDSPAFDLQDIVVLATAEPT